MAKDNRGRELPKGIRLKGSKYYGRVTINGKTYTVKGNTVTETKKKLAEVTSQVENGSYLQDNKITVKEWYKLWIDTYKKNEVKRGTIAIYDSTFYNVIDPEIGTLRLQNLRPQNIQKLYNYVAEKGYSKSYMGNVHKIMNGMCKQAVYDNIISANPVDKVKKPKHGIKEIESHKALTPEEQKLFMDNAQDSYFYNLFVVLLTTGLRIGEATGLKFSDIDKEENVLKVRRTLKSDNSGYYIDSPKSKASMRDIPLLAKTKFAIITQNSYYRKDEFKEYVFLNHHGEFLNTVVVQKEINRICKNIQETHPDFERFTCHTFRHTFATRAIENGMQPQTLKAILGHSTLAMTMDLYSHVMPNTKASEMDLIAKAL